MAIGYHFTLSANKDSILKTGLRRSKSGLDGPGVYVYKAPLRKALSEAALSIADSHWPNNCDHIFADLIVFEIEYDKATVRVEWDDYVVLDVDTVPAGRVKYIGEFHTLDNTIT